MVAPPAANNNLPTWMPPHEPNKFLAFSDFASSVKNFNCSATGFSTNTVYGIPAKDKQKFKFFLQ